MNLLTYTPDTDDSESSPPKKKKDVYEPKSSGSKSSGSSSAKQTVVVEDEDEEEESDDEEDEDSTALNALKAQFDDANRLASKLIQGQAYERAVEKLTEALELAPKVPGASKHIITLYNNRSAMYEKLKAYDKAMADITVVLAMDMLHTRVHLRRARIFEAQGKMREALDDYVFATIVQQQRGEATTADSKVQELAKAAALEQVPLVLAGLKASADAIPRALPSKAQCRNYFESYASVHAWKSFYYPMTRADLENAYDAATAAAADADGSDLAAAADLAADRAALNLICYDIAHNNICAAFENVQQMPLPDSVISTDAPVTPLPDSIPDFSCVCPYLAAVAAVDSQTQVDTESSSGDDNGAASTASTVESDRLMSLAFELKGSEYYLKFQPTLAIKAFKQALVYLPENIDARLKLANVYLETGHRDLATNIYDNILAFCDKLSSGSYTKTETKTEADAEAPAESADEAAVALQQEQQQEESSEVKMQEDAALNEYITRVRAWTLLHRPLVYLTRDDQGAYVAGAITLAMADIEAVLKLTAPLKTIPTFKAARLSALIRMIHTLSQSKAMVGEPPAADDQHRIAECITEARELYPNSQSVLLIAAELSGMDGGVDIALKLIEQADKCEDAIIGDCTPLFLKASTITSKSMFGLSTNHTQEQMMISKKLFDDADALYQQALELEPSAIEVISQYAQFKSTLGHLDKALELYQEAIRLARTRDDLQDLYQMSILSEAQLNVVKQVSAASP